jgi:hypothetical protein
MRIFNIGRLAKHQSTLSRESGFTGLLVISPEADFVDTGLEWTAENRAEAVEFYQLAMEKVLEGRELPILVTGVSEASI